MGIKRDSVKSTRTTIASQGQSDIEAALLKAAKKPVRLSFLDDFGEESRAAIESVAKYCAENLGSNVKAVLAEVRSRGYSISEEAFRKYVRKIRSKGIDSHGGITDR